MDVMIGLDIGTTGVKAVAFTPDRIELAKAIVPTPTRRFGDRAEYDADELWKACATVLGRVTDQLERLGHTAAVLSCTSMGESGVPIDEHGRPTHPVIAWFDGRSHEQATWWAENLGEQRTTAITGLPILPKFGMPKLMWIRQHAPDAWAATRHWLNIADWANHRLCGAIVTDHSLASRTLVFDLAARRWSDELLDLIDIPVSMLGELVPSGQVIGTVHADGSAETGLRIGLPVVSGGQDHVCAAYALGVTEPGHVLDSIGTAEALFLVTEGLDSGGNLAASQIAQGAHVLADRTYAMVGLPQGGGRIDALRKRLGLGWDDFNRQADVAGPVQEVIDSVAIDSQALLDTLLSAAGVSSGVRHTATGGGVRNARLMQRKREIGGRPIDVPDVAEATSLGAALLAGRAVGLADIE
jgi:xylulokinase